MTEQSDEAIAAERAARARAFLACTQELTHLLGIEPPEVDADAPDRKRARHLAIGIRKTLKHATHLPEALFEPIMAAGVHDPDPSFCGWFVVPAVHVFGRRRVLERLVEYLRSGTDAQRSGATRAWYQAHVPVGGNSSDTPRDPALDDADEATEAWLEESLRVYLDESIHPSVRYNVLHMIPPVREQYPVRLHDLYLRAVDTARVDPAEGIRHWAGYADRDPA
ncbi:hypothetical protein [Streptacidiphilus jiangxiensis]|uniref:Uncharacterized protein n=1 Tax=Streptacidiphilus jiangxiensis TaxID=235985 RepID=A0A1H7U3V7_STRJI|nr:hypothetical protein [Streptacidiphilus jiangxiensis]SEL91750.1 hypothetical protein SAMN05414137_11567 [Streptacidiphilus jiangxiensis]